MKKNTGLKILTGVVVAVTVLIVINSRHHSDKSLGQTHFNHLNEAIASQFNDNIRDVAAKLQETEKKLMRLEAAHKQSANENKPSATTNTELMNELNQLKEQIATLKTRQETTEENNAYTTNLNNTTTSHYGSTIQDVDEYLMKHENNPLQQAYWERLNSKQKTLAAKLTKQPPATPEKISIPYYTIPAGSDLGHTTLLSALIGEVPVEGKLMQPLFPFSAIINKTDLMAANGIALPPAIAGMKVTGFSIGVGSFLDNISCVRAYVTSALFVFEDGHFVSVGKEQMNGSAEMINNDSLGYLTTPFGNPCIKGQYISNAPRVLAAMMTTDGLKGLGNALSQWQMTYTANANGTTSTPTGSMGQYALGGALSQGSVKAADWLEKRIQGSFDMVFVPASIASKAGFRPNQFSLHITQSINLDKDTNGRRLDYGHSQQASHDFSLR